MNEPIQIVGYSWVESGGRGYVQMNLFYGKPEDAKIQIFYLNEAEALNLGYQLEGAVKRGLGTPPAEVNVETATEDLVMDPIIVLRFSSSHAHLDRPRDCRAIARQESEVQIISATGQRAFLTCVSPAAAIDVQAALQSGNLSDVRLSNDIIKMQINLEDEVHAAGLSADEIAEMNRDYQRVAEDCWRKRSVKQ